jgi:hypothetical protein
MIFGAADVDPADPAVGGVVDEESAGFPLVDVAREDRGGGYAGASQRVAFSEPAADQRVEHPVLGPRSGTALDAAGRDTGGHVAGRGGLGLRCFAMGISSMGVVVQSGSVRRSGATRLQLVVLRAAKKRLLRG